MNLIELHNFLLEKIDYIEGFLQVDFTSPIKNINLDILEKDLHKLLDYISLTKHSPDDTHLTFHVEEVPSHEIAGTIDFIDSVAPIIAVSFDARFSKKHAYSLLCKFHVEEFWPQTVVGLSREVSHNEFDRANEKLKRFEKEEEFNIHVELPEDEEFPADELALETEDLYVIDDIIDELFEALPVEYLRLGLHAKIEQN